MRGDGGREPEESPRADGERAQHEPRDGGEEDGEELPRLQAHLGGPRRQEPHGEADRDGDDEGHELCTGGLGLGVRIGCLGGEERQEAAAAARDGGQAMMLRRGKGEGVVREGEGGGEVVDEETAAEVARRRYRERRAAGDGEAEALHRRPRKAAERSRRRAVVSVVQFAESDLFEVFGSLETNG